MAARTQADDDARNPASDDAACVRFLQWALPQLQRRWPGYRRVRRQVCRRIVGRLRVLGLDGFAAYRQRLEGDGEEWSRLDGLLAVTITRFYRDRRVFERLQQAWLPELLEERGGLRIWCAGCASGEEPYSLALVAELALRAQFPPLVWSLLASDIDPVLLQRARRACYPFSAVKNLPAPWRERAFTQRGDEYCLDAPYRKNIEFVRHDVRDAPLPGPFDLLLCRNLVFTYFTEPVQREIAAGFARVLRPGGLLLLGVHEQLPATAAGFAARDARLGLYQRRE